ncbi:MAG TPA: VOC family protein [Terriglobia bacterium]|nr:VOC family protein [Terriglobia bacterium]
MAFSAHLVFDGQCEKAFQFYAECFGAKIISMMKWNQTPAADQAPPGAGDRIVHATMNASGTYVFGADAFPGKYEKPQGFFVLFSVNDSEQAERIFNKLADGGTIDMPMQETFWAARYGVVRDRFGIPWEINCSKQH